jgi:hypothetical protein
MISSLPTTLHLTVNGNAVTARLIDSPTARDFIRLLPLTLPMNDLFNREKFGHLPRALANTGKSVHRYAVGEIAYWPPGPDIAVFYRHDGESIPDPGVIVIGKVNSGIEAFGLRGAATVRFELSDHDASSRQPPIAVKRSGEQS